MQRIASQHHHYCWISCRFAYPTASHGFSYCSLAAAGSLPLFMQVDSGITITGSRSHYGIDPASLPWVLSHGSVDAQTTYFLSQPMWPSLPGNASTAKAGYMIPSPRFFWWESGLELWTQEQRDRGFCVGNARHASMLKWIFSNSMWIALVSNLHVHSIRALFRKIDVYLVLSAR